MPIATVAGVTAMQHRVIATVLLSLSLAAYAAPRSVESEARMRQQVLEASWPADIVRLADEYLRDNPDAAFSPEARGLRDRAASAMQALRSQEVRLFRSAFERATTQPQDRSRDVRLAALADKDAALRMATANRPDDARPTDGSRYVGWLQYASMLGSDRASYELAVYYRKQDQPALAARYEARAVELGFTLPRWLDHVRK